jgi:hypothetical protein
VQALLAAEVGGLARGGLADQNDARARRLELLASAIQLDRVLLAENSAVVAQPDQRYRVLAPQIPETDVVAVVVRQHDVYERVGTRGRRGALPS